MLKNLKLVKACKALRKVWPAERTALPVITSGHDL